MSDEPVIVTRHPQPEGAILEIVINRPEVHNAVNGEAAAILLDAWTTFQADDSLSVAILRGEGPLAFCAGADLKALNSLASFQDSTGTVATAETGPMGGSRILQTKPVITVAQGFAYAGGLELFCHGHIRIAEPAATFSVACRRWGVPLIDGGTVHLPRLLGWGSALPLIITGQRISAERAFQIGLVWELVPAGEGRTRAFRMAEQICALPQDCLRADLASAIEAFSMPIEDAYRREAENFAPVMTSPSTAQGIERFIRGDRNWFE